MPQVKDITGDLGKLRDRKVRSTGSFPHTNPKQLERKPAFNSFSFFFWTLIFLFGCLQFGFLAWLA